MVVENFPLDIVPSLVEVGKGYLDAILRKIVYININDPNLYYNVSNLIASMIAVQLNVS
jgi:hypothetical protein